MTVKIIHSKIDLSRLQSLFCLQACLVFSEQSLLLLLCELDILSLLAVFEPGLLDLVVRVEEATDAVLLSIEPLPRVDAAIGPPVDALATLLVHHVVAFEEASISPSVNAFSIHLIVIPVAVEGAAVMPAEGSLTIDLVVLEVAFVLVTVSPNEASFALLFPILVIAFKFCAVRPFFAAEALLLVVFPNTLEYVPGHLDKFSPSTSASLVEVAFKDVSFGRKMLALALLEPLIEEAFVLLAVGPNLYAKALLLVFSHLSRVNRPIFKDLLVNIL